MTPGAQEADTKGPVLRDELEFRGQGRQLRGPMRAAQPSSQSPPRAEKLLCYKPSLSRTQKG
jgi:hypothetical protein